MNILSLFDGMACGMIAMKNAGVNVEHYDAYEVDPYAIKTAKQNFPEIVEHGDVFEADFSQYDNIDFMIGGSPCTYWSIAQKNNRETEASGLGWDLFSKYVEALNTVKPKFFIYENNRSMSNQIRDSIRKAFGFEEICINSALVSAQNRRRYYWIGKLNAKGTYDKVEVAQPDDKGILLSSVLDGYALKEKANCIAGNRGGMSLYHDIVESRHNIVAEPIECIDDVHNGKALSMVDGKEHNVYLIKNRTIVLKDKPIKIDLEDGYWLFRKITVAEAKRLQTVPDYYEFPVSNAQAMKQLGNGWTCDVITHLIKSCLEKI